MRTLWITGHTPPQIHRTRLRPRAWKELTSGERLPAPPEVNYRGDDIRECVKEAEHMLAESRT